ncbi:Nucleoside 2-deoxyribosyltransferase [Clostridium cavendishii DSM 21758]|uniref:Nucleoside 2-deoxyribosyltransferase n=1 Tax=Clostridium cavendishii DSM 21758 TaxID=1121302 RepID=A0A1M6J1Q6_9CLOT|nr:nucleoside 2-deoxyribosyltransferase [Clostridium cavendishii]SHJ40664.1 Nucleoside 2-deoxyribosyltransferase [Clostridium cavendishii DSM 21758]
MEKTKVTLELNENEQKLLYLAGKLFKDADINQRLYEEKLINEKCNQAGKEINIYNPINNDEITFDSNTNANKIFMGDLNSLAKSNVVLAELDDEDSGTMYELGIVTGINLIYDLLKEGYTMDQIMKAIPKKDIYAHMSDIRQDRLGSKDAPWGINQFVVGGIEFNEHGKILKHVEEAIDEIVKNI